MSKSVDPLCYILRMISPQSSKVLAVIKIQPSAMKKNTWISHSNFNLCSHTLTLEAWVWTPLKGPFACIRTTSSLLGFQKTDPHRVWPALTFGPALGRGVKNRPPWFRRKQRGRWCLSTWQSFVSSLKGGRHQKVTRWGFFLFLFSGSPTPPRYRRYCIGCYLGSHEEWGLLFFVLAK